MGAGLPTHVHLIDVAWKTCFFYFFLLALLRLTGKREIGALAAIDLVGFIMISEAAIISIADSQIPFIVGVTPVLLIGALAWIMSLLSLKDQRVRGLVEGGPSVLINHGRIDERQLRRLRYNIGDLLAELRAKNFWKIEDVEFAILEHTGKLSVIPRAGAQHVTADDLRTLRVTDADPATALGTPTLPVPVVSDGNVDEELLAQLGRDRDWLKGELAKMGHPDLSRVLLATLEGQDRLKVVAATSRATLDGDGRKPQPPQG